MSKISVSADLLAKVKHFSDGGDVIAQTLQSLLTTVRTLDLTAGAEASNVIRVTGQVRDAEGNAVKAVTDVLLTSVPVAGAGTMAIGTKGTVKVGATSKNLWLETDANGAFEVDVTNVNAEVNLVSAQIDNGETEMIKLTFA